MDDARGQSSNQSVDTITANAGQQHNTDNSVPDNKPISDLRYIVLDKGTKYYYEKDGVTEHKFTRTKNTAFVFDKANPEVKTHEFMFRSRSSHTTAILPVDGVLHHGLVRERINHLNPESQDFGVIYKKFLQHAEDFNVISKDNPVKVDKNGNITLRGN